MAIFSNKTEQDEKPAATTEAVDGTVTAGPDGSAIITVGHRKALIVPRLSEKSNQMGALNKYVFKIEGKINKIELRKAVEKAYGAKILRVNMITVKGKVRRSGRTLG